MRLSTSKNILSFALTFESNGLSVIVQEAGHKLTFSGVESSSLIRFEDDKLICEYIASSTEYDTYTIIVQFNDMCNFDVLSVTLVEPTHTIQSQDDARALFKDAIENMGIFLPTLARQIYNFEDAIEEDECMMEDAFDSWLETADVPDEAFNSWTLVD